MICIYCHNKCHYPDEFVNWVYECTNCSTEWIVQYHYLDDWINIFNKDFLVSIEPDTKRVEFYSRNFDPMKIITVINYLPFISPSNINEWVQRINNIKVFG